MRSISAFVKLSEAEVSLMKSILTEEKFSKKVFDLIVSIPLDSIKYDSEKFVRHCKECKGNFVVSFQMSDQSYHQEISPTQLESKNFVLFLL